MVRPIIAPDRIINDSAIDIHGNIIEKNGWDVYEYPFDPSQLSSTTYALDITIHNTFGKNWWIDENNNQWDSMLFNLKQDDISSFNTFFTNFNENNPSESANTEYYYATPSYTEYTMHSNYENGEKVNNILVSKVLPVHEGMTIEFNGTQRFSMYVPTLVAFDGSMNPLVEHCSWERGFFRYVVPNGVEKIVIQLFNDSYFDNGEFDGHFSVKTEMPPVLLSASYGLNDKILDKIVTAKYNIEDENFDGTYYRQYTINRNVTKVLVVAQASNDEDNVEILKNTWKDVKWISHNIAKEEIYPHIAGAKDYTTYGVLAERFEAVEKKVFGNSESDRKEYVTKYELDKAIKESLGSGGADATGKYPVYWKNIKEKPDWLKDYKPDAEYFGAVPQTRKVNGLTLDKNINIPIPDFTEVRGLIEHFSYERLWNKMSLDCALEVTEIRFNDIPNRLQWWPTYVIDEDDLVTDEETNEGVLQLEAGGFRLIGPYRDMTDDNTPLCLGAKLSFGFENHDSYITNDERGHLMLHAPNGITIDYIDKLYLSDGSSIEWDAVNNEFSIGGGNLRVYNSANTSSAIYLGSSNFCYLSEDSLGHMDIVAVSGITLGYVDQIVFSDTNVFENINESGVTFNSDFWLIGKEDAVEGAALYFGKEGLCYVKEQEEGYLQIHANNGMLLDNVEEIVFSISNNSRLTHETYNMLKFTSPVLFTDHDNNGNDTDGDILYKKGNDRVSIPSQFNIIKEAFVSGSTFSDVQQYIVSNLK